jgi:glutathione synthase/RimK-type ligase-like ATP-grasp enzyme
MRTKAVQSWSKGSSAFRAIVISSEGWAPAGRLAAALAKVGYRVALLSPVGSVVRTLKSVSWHYNYLPWARLKSITSSINEFLPNIVICADDQAVLDIHRLHQQASRTSGKAALALVELIENSLGNPAHFDIVRAKSRFMLWAQSADVRCPKTVVVSSRDGGEDALLINYPIMVKADASSGGTGVRLARSKDEVRKAVLDLSISVGWQAVIMKMLHRKYRLPLLRSGIFSRKRTVSLQQFIAGRPANRAVVCYKGEVLAGVSAEAIESQYEYGPSSVIRIIDHDEMKSTCDIVVKRLELSGFIGFDFILDVENRAWLIEINPRVTPTCHLHTADGNTLPAKLLTRMYGQAQTQETAPLKGQMIALFPQELMRCKSSKLLYSCYHDVPWEELYFVRKCLKSVLRRGVIERARRALRMLAFQLNVF